MLDLSVLTDLCQQYGSEITQNVPVSELTTFKIGGPCIAEISLANMASVSEIFSYLRKNQVPHYLIGRGSNLLCPDEGYNGVVLKLEGEFAGQPVLCEDGVTIRCGAGVSLKNLCMFALDHHLTGLEFAYGIPGSVGGAVYMNAGAYNGEISDAAIKITALMADGKVAEFDRESAKFDYRYSVFMENHGIILEAEFRLEKGEQDLIREKMQDLLGRRKAKQPLEFPSAGSTFKRPEGSFASKLIDECGLKGYTVGDAQVSEKHAGFVINRGNATFADVMAVCAHVQKTVQKETGFRLEMEPEIMDFKK